MKKLLSKFFLILITFLIFDYIIGSVLDTLRCNSPDGRYYKTNYSLEKCKEDIIIFGSSFSETNIVPFIIEDSLKMTCWNTGRGGQGLPYYICIEQGILNRYIPKIAIVCIGEEDLSNELNDFYEAVGFLRPYYLSNKEIRLILDRISFFEKYFIYSRLYAYNSSYYYLLRPYLIKELDGKREDKGWKPRAGNISEIISKPLIINTFKDLDSNNIVLFNEFILNLAENGCKVFITISPIIDKIIINTSTIEYIKKYIRKVTNVYLIDFELNKIFVGDYKLFYDRKHLNKDGAIKFTALLSNKIKNITDSLLVN